MYNEGFNEVYQAGLQDEKKVIRALRARGWKVDTSTRDENYWDDIDCWVGDTPVSIKAQHAGLTYQNIAFETQRQLTATGEWEPSWFYTGKATMYAILQGTTLKMYTKQQILDYIETKGDFDHRRTLTKARRAYQGGSYRFSDAECGYIRWSNIKPCQEFEIS